MASPMRRDQQPTRSCPAAYAEGATSRPDPPSGPWLNAARSSGKLRNRPPGKPRPAETRVPARDRLLTPSSLVHDEPPPSAGDRGSDRPA